MLDINFIRENADLVKKNAKNKGSKVDIDKLLDLDEHRRKSLQQIETIEATRNKMNDQIVKATAADKKKMIGQLKEMGQEIDQLRPRLEQIEEEYQNLMFLVPQIADPETPIGPDDSYNKVQYKFGEIPKFKFKPKSHLELCKSLDIADFERGVKVMGTRGYFLKNEGARLEMAVLQYALDFISQRGFTLMSVPAMAPDKFFYGTGFLPFGQDEMFNVYEKEKHVANLVGTSEIPLCSYYADEILPEKNLPQKMSAWSPCFRTEVGSYGKDATGLYRRKQFYKVEQVILCKADPAEGKKMIKELLTNSEDFLKSLNIPYRVVRNSTGDMGAGKVEMYDIESWMPYRDGYGETHSCSYLGDWQARRLKIRYKDSHGKTQLVHTLNNTLVASPRILIPLLELNQKEDGSVEIPQILREYMNGLSVIKPRT